jgi:Tol biopolymer transport system component
MYTPVGSTERQMHSETDTRAQDRRELPNLVVRDQLERILASDVFSRSQQLRRFLSFIVEQRLAGQGHSIKESVLAHELYGKGTDFDGGTDPVVRVDARRLRDKLREYYDGRSDPVVISLPKGSYVPVFEPNFVSPSHTTPPVVAEEAQQTSPAVVITPPVQNLSRAGIAAGTFAIVVAVVAAALAWRAFTTPVSGPVQLLPLASFPGVEGPPALSPDGNLVAFAWSGPIETGPTDIYVKAVSSEALRRLTATPGSETSPAWSPDGHSIAFVRDGHGVFTMSQLGGDERQVWASGTHVAWAGDSKSVLIRDREADNRPFGIYQVFLDTLDRRQLTQAPVGAGDWRFEVSPDGRTLAFIRYEKRGIADVFVVPMAGGEPRRLSNWNTSIEGLSWTPDGREIVYSLDGPPVSRLWRIRANSTTPDGGSAIADIPVSATNPSISRPMPGQPARLAFQTTTRDVDLQLTDLEARPRNDILESRPFANSTRIEGSARFSPDGSRIAVSSFRSGAQEIWVAGRDGSGLQQVTTLAAQGVWVGGWSPDGRRVAFEASVAGNSDVYIVGADGGHLRRLTAETLHRRSSIVVGGRAVDLFRIDTRGSDCGHLADLSQRKRSHPTDTQRRLRAAGISGRPVPLLSRSSSGGLPSGGTARLMRLPLVADTRNRCSRASAVSVVGHGYRDRVRHARGGLRCDRRAPVQRSAGCPRGPAGISDTGNLHAHDGVPRRALGIGNEDGRESILTSCDSTTFAETAVGSDPACISKRVSFLKSASKGNSHESGI